MVNIDEVAYAIGANKKNENKMTVWYGEVSSVSPFKVKPDGSSIGVECVKVCNASVGDRVFCITSNGQGAAIGRVGGERHDWVKPWTLIAEVSGSETASFASIAEYEEIFITVAYENPYPTNTNLFCISCPVDSIYEDETSRLRTGSNYWDVEVALSYQSMKLERLNYYDGVSYKGYSTTKLYAR